MSTSATHRAITASGHPRCRPTFPFNDRPTLFRSPRSIALTTRLATASTASSRPPISAVSRSIADAWLSSRSACASILDASERAILQSVERGEWPRVLAVPTDKARYARYAKMTLQRLRRA
jgi:hypothetical protein